VKASYASEAITFALTFLASTKEASSFTNEEEPITAATIAFVIDKANQVKESPLQAVLAMLAKEAMIAMVARVAKQVAVVEVKEVVMAMASYFRIWEKQKSSLLNPLHLIIGSCLFKGDVIHHYADFLLTASC
jgi:hypothetical protein